VFEILTAPKLENGRDQVWDAQETYARTLENSCDGCITKLSDDGVHEMRCDMVLSSSILQYSLISIAQHTAPLRNLLVEFVYKCRLYYLGLMYGRRCGYRGWHHDVVGLLVVVVRYGP
jgi:hypothetical protein